MNLHDLVFTTKSPLRYCRHILFWLVIYLVKVPADTLDYKSNVGTQVIDMIYCYTIIYWVVPHYFSKQKYISFITWVASFTLVVFVARTWFYLWINNYIAEGDHKIFYETCMHVTLFIYAGPIMRCCLMLAFKMLKGYYLEVKEKEILLEETNTAELQLLKAQVQPHFLFNTLNNIYSFTLSRSPHAADLVLKLYDTINYMNRDCAGDAVLLEKELKMIIDYVGLEKVRYGERLKMEVKIEGDPRNKFIAPLLLIPFVENSFKHGTSKMLEHPWIRMKIEILDEQLDFELQNSKPNQTLPINGKNGIGLANARKRLSLLYPNNHTLEISSTTDSFLVRLKLPLENSLIPEEQSNNKPQISEPAF